MLFRSKLKEALSSFLYDVYCQVGILALGNAIMSAPLLMLLRWVTRVLTVFTEKVPVPIDVDGGKSTAQVRCSGGSSLGNLTELVFLLASCDITTYLQGNRHINWKTPTEICIFWFFGLSLWVGHCCSSTECY